MDLLSVQNAAINAVATAATFLQMCGAVPQAIPQQLTLNVQGTGVSQNYAAISRDGRFAVTGGTQIILWETQTGRQIRQVAGYAMRSLSHQMRAM